MSGDCGADGEPAIGADDACAGRWHIVSGRALLVAYHARSNQLLNWRQENGVNLKVGGDVGYGFGWQMQIGSITPYSSGTPGTTAIDRYVYSDGTGAQYRLDVNNNGVWSSSSQSVYVWFDANANRLHFRDGTFWVMGCTSSGGEADADTMYPTVIEDVNGNQVLIVYGAGAGYSLGGEQYERAYFDDYGCSGAVGRASHLQLHLQQRCARAASGGDFEQDSDGRDVQLYLCGCGAGASVRDRCELGGEDHFASGDDECAFDRAIISSLTTARGRANWVR